MKQLTKSVSLLTITTLLPLLLLTSCADTRWPTWITGEPEDSVLNAPRAVGRPPSSQDKAYPNLSTVPAKPTTLSTSKERKQTVRTMETEKEESQDIKERLDALPTPERTSQP